MHEGIKLAKNQSNFLKVQSFALARAIITFEVAPLFYGLSRVRNGVVAKFESTYDVTDRDVTTSRLRNVARSAPY